MMVSKKVLTDDHGTLRRITPQESVVNLRTSQRLLNRHLSVDIQNLPKTVLANQRGDFRRREDYIERLTQIPVHQ